MRYQTFLRKSTYRRYAIFIATVIFSYYSIQAYVNNKSIDVSIENVQENITNIQEEIAFNENFYTNYLQTEYATYFLGHENGQIYGTERIIRFSVPPVVEEEVEEEMLLDERPEEEIYLETPKDSRRYFFSSKLEELFGR